MASRNWNPSEPTVLGLEWAGMRRVPLPLSQDVEYGHTFQASATEDIDTAAFHITEPSVPFGARSTALVTVYQRDAEASTEGGNETEFGIVTAELVPATGGAVTAPTVLVGGATVAECVATPSDNKYVHVQSTGILDLEFDTAGRFTGKRILNVTLRIGLTRYVDSTDTQDEALITLRTGANVIDAGTAKANPTNGPYQVQHLPLGEVYYDTTTLPNCWPWTVANIQDFAPAGTTVIRVVLDSLPEFVVEYAALEVRWCEENRVAVGALLLGSGATEEAMQVGRHVVDLRSPAGVDNWTKTLDNYYAVTVVEPQPSEFGNARAAQPSRRHVGASPFIPLVDAFTVFEQHQGRVAPRLASGVLGSVGVDSRVCPIKFVTTAALVPTDFAPYGNVFGAHVYNGASTKSQEIEQRSGGGAVDYPWLRFYARIVGDSADVASIDITTVDGTMNYLATTLLALPEIWDGWREVTVEWPAGQEPSFDNSGTTKQVDFTTTQGNIANRWEILGVDSEDLMIDAPTNGNPTYGTGAASYEDAGTPDVYADLVVTVHTAAPALTNVNTTVGTAPVPGRTAGAPTPCQVSEYDYVYVEWDITTVSAADFAYYEVQRKDTIDTTYAAVAKIEDRSKLIFFDLEPRLGVVSTYRVRVCRADGICSAWSAEMTETPTTGDVDIASGCGFLAFSTNEYSPQGIIIFSESYDNDPTGTFGMVEANDYVLTRHYGRFGTQSFHPTERGGVSFERTLLVNGGTATTNRADHEFDRLRDLAYQDVPYVCVRDDLGNRWFATIIVPEVSVRRPGNVELASVRIIESTNVPWPVADQVTV